MIVADELFFRDKKGHFLFLPLNFQLSIKPLEIKGFIYSIPFGTKIADITQRKRVLGRLSRKPDRE